MQIVILAAGHGKRMKSEVPKPLVRLSGKPIISYLLEAIEKSGVCSTPVIVVSPTNIDVFKKTLGEKYIYVLQDEQLGTGHAVQMAKDVLVKNGGRVFVLYGDHPWVSAETIRAVAKKAEERDRVLTMATATVPDFEEWRAGFDSFGRIIRGTDGNVIKNVERKDATPEEIAVKEVNPCYFCFKMAWLWPHLEKVKNENAQQEYYLTDLIGMAVAEGEAIATVPIEPKEALGINTKEQLELCEELAENS